MRHMTGVVVACIGSLAGCYNSVTTPDLTCDAAYPLGELHVVISAAAGFFGTGEIVFVGDTLPLAAEVRPVTGASIDFWGSGTCQTNYGDPVPATIEWSSSDVRIATVSATGVVSGRQRGDATITARAAARNLSASHEIGVWVRGAGGP
jgi:Bacterial Ig-like domain (group 2)